MLKNCSLFLIILFSLTATTNQAAPTFDGERAFYFLEKQCEFGPRAPGLPGHKKCLDYLVETLKKHADEVTTQQFMFSFGQPQRTVTATNVISRFQPFKSKRILLCAHWDTRPWADSDPNPENHDRPILGANDGASGVAVLLHLAELIAADPPDVGIDIVLFDAEDAGMQGQDRTWARGSAAFAREFGSRMAPNYAILLDMIGDNDLKIYQEEFSVVYARQVVDLIWDKAAALGVSEFIPTVGYAVYDDHVPLLQAGIQCANVIDFNYPEWHTMKDTPEACSATSLGKVGRVITAVIYDEN